VLVPVWSGWAAGVAPIVGRARCPRPRTRPHPGQGFPGSADGDSPVPGRQQDMRTVRAKVFAANFLMPRSEISPGGREADLTDRQLTTLVVRFQVAVGPRHLSAATGSGAFCRVSRAACAALSRSSPHTMASDSPVITVALRARTPIRPALPSPPPLPNRLPISVISACIRRISSRSSCDRCCATRCTRSPTGSCAPASVRRDLSAGLVLTRSSALVAGRTDVRPHVIGASPLA
jgi:hypothetical protein